MASTSSSPAAEERERKRKRTAAGGRSKEVASSPNKWRTRREHEMYSSKLFEALRLVRAGEAPAPPQSRAVKEAADRALAVAARGRTRWSRAILASRRRRRALRMQKATSAGPARFRPPVAARSSPEMSGRSPAIATRARVLGRLVPGCRKLPFPALLDEASDYIAALEMQVRAMSALAEILSAVSGGGGGGGAAAGVVGSRPS